LGEGEALEGEVFAEGVHLDAVGVHFDAFGVFFAVELLALGAEGGAFGEIGDALKGEELAGGEVFGADGVVGGIDDGFVHVLGRGGSSDGGHVFEFGVGEFGPFPCTDAVVEGAEEGDALVERFQGFAGNVQAETFRTRFADAFEDGIVGLAREPNEKVGKLGFGE
jgi:hypothetical protein